MPASYTPTHNRARAITSINHNQQGVTSGVEDICKEGYNTSITRVHISEIQATKQGVLDLYLVLVYITTSFLKLHQLKSCAAVTLTILALTTLYQNH